MIKFIINIQQQLQLSVACGEENFPVNSLRKQEKNEKNSIFTRKF